MTREQTVIRTGDTEIPIRAFDEPGFWVLVALAAALFVWWTRRK